MSDIEKNLTLCNLYDRYGELLSEKKRTVFELCYWNDLSLSEAAEHTGTSRQAVRELLEHACGELEAFERVLGDEKTFSAISELSDKCAEAISAAKDKGADLEELARLVSKIKELSSQGKRL